MILLNSQQAQAEKSFQQLTTDITSKEKDTLKQEKSNKAISLKHSRKNKICLQCGKEKGGRGLVCRECYDKNRRIEIELQCDYCNKKYKVLKYQYDKAVKRGNESKYCSKECSCKAINEKRFGIKRCKVCGNKLPPKSGKYCSNECLKIGYILNGIKAKRLDAIECEICKVEFYPNSSRTKYCSLECSNKAHSIRMTGKGNSRYIDGMSYNKDFQDIKPIIKERDCHKCVICGMEEKKVSYTRNGKELLKTNLHIHHIDENIKNNSENNLITLCESCHISIHKAKQ